MKRARWVLVSLVWSIANSVQPALAQQAATNIEFVRIQPGEFTMGCIEGDSVCGPSESSLVWLEWRTHLTGEAAARSAAGPDEPPHHVRITKEFEIGKYEVTQAQWQSVMGSNPSSFKGANRPVERVSWNDIQAFLGNLKARGDGYRYRLPTEAEWEYVTQAGAPGRISPDDGNWYDKNSGQQTHPVGLKQPNAWGLYDTTGNVWEWVQDWYGESYYRTSPPNDPPGPSSGRTHVIKGGSFSDPAGITNPSRKYYLQPTVKVDNLGFRCVREKIR